MEIAARETFGDVLYDVYGSTEMGYVTVASPEDKRACPGTVGRPFPGVDVLLLDDHRRPVADGEVGELFARSSLTVEGYHGNDAATRASRFGDYFSVGDLALRDSRGYLQLVGRKTDMVISGGMNVYPAEIESVLTTHSAIREAAVIGVPDEKWGEALVAFVVARIARGDPRDGGADRVLQDEPRGIQGPAPLRACRRAATKSDRKSVETGVAGPSRAHRGASPPLRTIRFRAAVVTISRIRPFRLQ